MPEERDKLGVVLGSLAVQRKWITPEQLREALAEQGRDFAAGRPARPLGEILVERGALKTDQVLALQEAERRGEALSTPSAVVEVRPLEPGESFGKYSILRQLGRGGMATVYEALDPALQRRVALKVLHPPSVPDLMQDEERFLREARLAAGLPKHPHIVGVYEAGLVGGRRFIAAEMIDGMPMDDWRKEKSPDLRRQVSLLRDVALAVHHAHEHEVVHRDLKPANILVDAKEQPHLTDFGLAKALRPEKEETALTAAGMTVGTPAYMSPEQAQGLRGADRRTDVYSLGVMLYELIAHQVPFSGETGAEIMIKAARDPVPKPSTVRRAAALPSVDRALERICLRAMARDPADRYSTAQLLALDLGRWMKGEPAGGRRLSRKAVLGIAGLAAGIVLGAAAVALRPPAAPPKPPTPVPPAATVPPGTTPAGRNAQGYEEFRHERDGSPMILIPEGEFLRGSDTMGEAAEKPQHRVHLRAFLIDKTEVTVRQFRRFVEATGYVTEAETGGGAYVFRGTGRERDPSVTWKSPPYPGSDDHPVTCVGWRDAQEYCRWAGKRLPTEAEWERAARGTDGRIWPWGNEWDPAKARAERKPPHPAAAGSHPDGASPCGLLDVSGNVSEFCADWFDPDAYRRGNFRNPTGPETGTQRILKGGSWFDFKNDVRLTRRFPREEAALPSIANGFRTARDAR